MFFFGAGASKPAGVGITSELVEEFKRFLVDEKDVNSKKLIDKIIVSLDATELDIELLMTAIEKLLGRVKDPLIKFYDENTFKIDSTEHLQLLQDKLKKFIQQVTSVKEDKIGYLEPLLSFDKPRTIFSVNYDTAIEQFCNVRRLRYTDGFEYEWNSKLFDDDEFDFHLYKIHGSIMWYKTNKNNYIKLPIPPTGNQKLIFGEEAMPLMLYPMQKWEFVEPLLEMLLQFKKSLEVYDFAIVVGYSFRDSHIVRIFQETARRNQKLIVIMVGPSARKRYEQKLKFYLDENGVATNIPSVLEDRVLCLQYGFEAMAIKLKEITDRCHTALIFEKNLQDDIIAGRPADPTALLSILADIEFLDRANKIKNNVEWFSQFTLSHVNTSIMLSCFKLFVIAEVQGQENSSNYWLYRFLTAFHVLSLLTRSKIQVQEFTMQFSNYDQLSGYSGTRNHLENLQLFIQNQRKLRQKNFTPILADLMDKLELWFRHMYEFSQGNQMGYHDYILKINEFTTTWKQSDPSDSISVLRQYLDQNGHVVDFPKNKILVLDAIMTIESEIINDIFDNHDNLQKYMLNKYKTRIVNPDKIE